MYSRRATIALLTGRMNTTFKIAKKIAKLISCTINVPSSLRNMRCAYSLRMQLGEQSRHVRDDQQHVERKAQRDNRERFEHADAQEHERQDVRARFGLTRDGFDGFGGHVTVADSRAERDAGDNDAEREQGQTGNKRFRSQD